MSTASSENTLSGPSAGGEALTMPPSGGFDWGLMGRQLWGVLRIELRYSLLSRRTFSIAFLAFVPVGLLLLWSFTSVAREFATGGATQGMTMFAWIFSGYMRTSIFLSALILFMSLFRGEILQRSLHYYFLSPIRREVLVVGKYLAAWIAGSLCYAASTTLIYLLVFLPLGPGALSRHLFQGPGLGDLLAYIGISIMAIGGYGAIFLLVGLFLKNPVVAAIVIWAWEGINFVLPALLKKFSVIFYLQSLYPVPLPQEMFAVVADPISAWLAVPGLMLFVVLLLGLSSLRARRMEINYGDD